MRQQKLSTRQVVEALLLIIGFFILMSIAGTSDMENQQMIAKELSLFHVER